MPLIQFMVFDFQWTALNSRAAIAMAALAVRQKMEKKPASVAGFDFAKLRDSR